MNQRKAGVLLTYFNKFMSIGINLVYVPLLLFYMGKEEYGLYQLMGSVIAYIGMMDFGFSVAITRFYTKYKALNDHKSMENLLATSAVIYIVLGAIITAAGGVAYCFLENIFGGALTPAEMASAKQIFIILVLGVLVCVEAQIFTAVIVSAEKFLIQRGITTVSVILQPIVVLLAMQSSPYAVTFVLVQTIFYTLSTLFQIYYAFRYLHISFRFHGYDKELVKGITGFSLAVFLMTVTDQIFFRSNQLILGAMSGTLAVAVYAIGSQIYMSYMPLAGIISGVFFPKVTEMVAKKVPMEVFSELFIRIGRLQFLLLGLILSGFVLFGRQFIHFWVGDDFLDAWWVALLVMTPFTVDIITGLGLTIMQARNDFWFRVKVGLTAAVMNVCLAIPAARYYGGVGCAAVTCLSVSLCYCLAMNWYYARKLHLEIKCFWNHIAGICFYVVMAMLLGEVFARGMSLLPLPAFVGLIFDIAFYVAVYVLLLYHKAFNVYERGLLQEGLRRLRGNRG